MMKRSGTLVAVAVMVAGLCLPKAAHAEYDYPGTSGFNSSLDKVGGLLKPASSALGSAAGKKTGDPTLDLQNELTERLKQAQKDIQRSQEERDLRDKVAKWRDQIDQLKGTRALPDIILANKQKQEEQKNREAIGLFSSLRQQTPGVSSADIQTNNLEPSCKSGVDFAGFKSLADQLGTEPFRYLRDNGQQILEDQNKEIKEAKIKNLQALAKHFDALASNNNNDFQQDITKADIFKQDNSLAASLAGLKQTGERQKKEIGDLRKDLVKYIFGDFIPKLSELGADNKKFAQVRNFFMDNYEAYRRAALDQAVAGAEQLKKNCEDNADFLGRENPLASRSMLNSAYQWAASVNPSFANSTLLPMLSQISDNARRGCTDATAKLEDLFGQQLQAPMQAMANTSDPRTLLQGAMSLIGAIASAQSQVGAALQPLMNDCQYMAKQIKRMKDYVGQVQASQQQQQGDQQVASSSRGRGRGRGRNGQNHNQLSGGQGRNSAGPRT